MYMYIYMCVYACMYACMCVCMYVCMHACMHACVYAYMYACMCVCAGTLRLDSQEPKLRGKPRSPAVPTEGPLTMYIALCRVQM